MRLALDLTEEGPEVRGAEGEGPISVAGAVINPVVALNSALWFTPLEIPVPL